MSRVANTVTITFGGKSQTVVLGENGFAKVRMAPDPPLDVHRSYPYVLHVTTTNGFFPRDLDPTSNALRFLGGFLRITFRSGPHGDLPGAPRPPDPGGGGDCGRAPGR